MICLVTAWTTEDFQASIYEYCWAASHQKAVTDTEEQWKRGLKSFAEVMAVRSGTAPKPIPIKETCMSEEKEEAYKETQSNGKKHPLGIWKQVELGT